MANTIEMVGKRFGKLVVKERKGVNKGGTVLWLCECDCGEKRIVEGTGLRAGRNKSCGCGQRPFDPLRKTMAYKIWLGMRSRCSDISSGKARKLYYEKGIRVCERWESFQNFFEDMGDRPKGMTIERIDGNKNYEPSNCKWATRKEQANNTTRNTKFEWNGESKNVCQWAEQLGIKANTIVYRLRRGWSVERALFGDSVSISTTRMLERKRECLVCGQEFIPRKTQLRVGHGKYCSQKCNGAARIINNNEALNNDH